MFVIDAKKTIHITRGDHATFTVSANNGEDENGNAIPYTFKVNDVVRFKVFKARSCEDVVLQKDVTITEESEFATIVITKDDTAFEPIISKTSTYWYEVEVNPDTYPQTIIGCDLDGEKLFIIYPEGGNKQ